MAVFGRAGMMRAKIVGLAASALLGAMATPAMAQTDEIQVYDASIATPGVFNPTWHNNYTPLGAKTPAFPGALVAEGSLTGVTDWFEAGAYLPLYSMTK